MRFIKVTLSVCLFSLLMFSCTKQSEVNSVIIKGLTALYKGQFKEASAYITPGSYPVIGFIQAVTPKAKIEMMHKADVKVEVLETDILPGDSVANVKVEIENYVDGTMENPVLTNKAKSEMFVLQKVNGKWLIDIQSK